MLSRMLPGSCTGAFANDAGGWIALLNFRQHVLADMQAIDLDRFFISGGKLDAIDWRTANPEDLYERVKGQVVKRLGI